MLIDACGIADCNAICNSFRSLCLMNVRSDITGQPSVRVSVSALACRFSRGTGTPSLLLFSFTRTSSPSSPCPPPIKAAPPPTPPRSLSLTPLAPRHAPRTTRQERKRLSARRPNCHPANTGAWRQARRRGGRRRHAVFLSGAAQGRPSPRWPLRTATTREGARGTEHGKDCCLDLAHERGSRVGWREGEGGGGASHFLPRWQPLRLAAA